MGHGDEIMATGFAKGARARGKRVAFGDGEKIRWHPHAVEIFRGNPNVAPPGSEHDYDLEWIAHYAGKRVYNHHFGDRWLWKTGFNNKPGEIFFTDEERQWAAKQGSDFILIEPNVPTFKAVAFNKQWPKDRYEDVAKSLISAGWDVAQFVAEHPYGPGHQITGTRKIKSPTFRHALAALARAKLYVGPEGGLHHGAAAVGIDAVVIFGGFIPPSATGYASHANIAVGEACGMIAPCTHCKEAMDSIKVNRVLDAAFEKLNPLSVVSEMGGR